MKNLKFNLSIYPKTLTYESVMIGLSEIFTIVIIGLFFNLLINQAYPITHLFFLVGIVLVITAGVLVEYVHKKREQDRFRRILEKILADN